jgi:hypothetical protein
MSRWHFLALRHPFTSHGSTHQGEEGRVTPPEITKTRVAHNIFWESTSIEGLRRSVQSQCLTLEGAWLGPGGFGVRILWFSLVYKSRVTFHGDFALGK